jgi:hypothetical protein
MVRSPKIQAHKRATEHAMATKPGPVIFMSGIRDPPLPSFGCNSLAKGFACAFTHVFSASVAAGAQAGIWSNAVFSEVGMRA